MLPFRTLDTATSTGPGATVDLEGMACRFGVQAIVTGSPSSIAFIIEGSLDGSNWDSIAFPNSTLTGGGLVTFGDNPYDPGDGGGTQFAKYVRYVRANLTTLSGGSSPTVTVWLAGVGIDKS